MTDSLIYDNSMTDSLIYDKSTTDSLIYDNSTTDSLIYDNSIKTSSFNSMSLSHVPFIFVLFVFLVNFSATTDKTVMNFLSSVPG